MAKIWSRSFNSKPWDTLAIGVITVGRYGIAAGAQDSELHSRRCNNHTTGETIKNLDDIQIILEKFGQFKFVDCLR